MYLGSEYNENEIQNLISDKKFIVKKVKNIAHILIDEFKKDKPVGIFMGKMEFGPRALCNRSILYHAKDITVNDWLNKRMNRTEFMPFAPVTIEEYAKQCFIGWGKKDVSADFMTMTYKCSKMFKKKCPAAVHVDGTARPQVVRKKDNPKLHKILKEYLKSTNDLAILNTSFNKHEEPIVENIKDATEVLKNNIINTLIIENHIVKNL